MTETIVQDATFIPLKQIRLGEGPFDFRLNDPRKKERLKDELLKHGQIYPVTLLDLGNSEYEILDGHLRCRIIQEIHAEEKRWESVVADIFSSSSMPVRDQFQLLCQANMKGKDAYGLLEKCRCLSAFHEKGLSKLEMAEISGFSINDIEEYLSLLQTPPALEEMLNKAPLPSYLAHQLLKSIDRWKGTGFEEAAISAAKEIFPLLQPGSNLAAWQFLLDFHLGGQRPFRGLLKRRR